MQRVGLWRFALPVTAVAAAALLGGCKKPSPILAELGHHGRYVGVGIYAPSTPWTKLVTAGSPASPSAAKLADDQAIIVVVDSDTGEVRACGDLSGYCVGMNPWRAGLAKAQTAPVDLTEHARATADEPAANMADNTAAPGSQ